MGRLQGKDLIIEAATVAASEHRATGQTYGDQPYFHHLSQVVRILQWAGVTDEATLAAGWLHDIIEDTPFTYEDVGEVFNEHIADIVWACTGNGHNRKTRVEDVNAKLKAEGCPMEAKLVKLADRIANMEMSADERRSMYKRYEIEKQDFMLACTGTEPDDREQATALGKLIMRLSNA
jgi:(p)ppGpp synthase/HD superfamily hydrolase